MAKNSRPTLKDVAQASGVAVTTVSGILNRRSYSWASEETKKRVFEAAEQLNYRPNSSARGLRLNQFMTVLLIVPDMGNAFFVSMFRRVQMVLEERGYETVLESTNLDVKEEIRILKAAINREVDGVIACTLYPGRSINLLKKIIAQKPLVHLGPLPKGHAIPVIHTDMNAGLREFLEHLHALGHRKLAYLDALCHVTDPGARFERCRDIAGDFGIEVPPNCFIESGPYMEDIKNNTIAWLRTLNDHERPTALLCSDDLAAIASMRGLIEEGYRIPEDMSVAGFNDIEIGRFLHTSLTTIRQPLERLVDSACDLLMDFMNSSQIPQEQVRSIASDLVIRESTSLLASSQRSYTGGV